MAETLRGEEAALVAVQSALAGRPGVLAGARGLSHFGEHSIGWVAVSALGALLQPRRRGAWLAAGVGAFVAHAAAVVLKRVVKRERPHHPAVTVNVATPSRLSFPSAHATSTTAASMLLARTTVAGVAGAADGVVALGAWRALPERRAHRRGDRSGRRQDGRSNR
jgi:membrane-associated phospholipid phosphatase